MIAVISEVTSGGRKVAYRMRTPNTCAPIKPQIGPIAASGTAQDMNICIAVVGSGSILAHSSLGRISNRWIRPIMPPPAGAGAVGGIGDCGGTPPGSLGNSLAMGPPSCLVLLVPTLVTRCDNWIDATSCAVCCATATYPYMVAHERHNLARHDDPVGAQERQGDRRRQGRDVDPDRQWRRARARGRHRRDRIRRQLRARRRPRAGRL